jgi:hypothetical protein
MGLFSDHGNSNHTCPTSTVVNQGSFKLNIYSFPVVLTAYFIAQESLINNLSFQHFTAIISGAFTAATCLISLYLIFRHATHYSIPAEQKQYLFPYPLSDPFLTRESESYESSSLSPSSPLSHFFAYVSKAKEFTSHPLPISTNRSLSGHSLFFSVLSLKKTIMSDKISLPGAVRPSNMLYAHFVSLFTSPTTQS